MQAALSDSSHIRNMGRARPLHKMQLQANSICQNKLHGYSAPPACSQEQSMTPPSEMNPDEVLRVKLEVLRDEHRDLDAAIAALQETGRDMLTISRLKKKKLRLKDEITRLSDLLTPAIIA